VDEIYSPCPWNDELELIEQQLEILSLLEHCEELQQPFCELDTL